MEVTLYIRDFQIQRTHTMPLKVYSCLAKSHIIFKGPWIGLKIFTGVGHSSPRDCSIGVAYSKNITEIIEYLKSSSGD